MKKDFSKKSNSQEASAESRSGWLWKMLGLMTIFIACAVVFCIYEFKNTHFSSSVYAYYSRMQDWISQHKSQLRQNLVKVKQIAVTKKDANPDIHFEFYTALPSMQVKVPDDNAQISPANKVIAANQPQEVAEAARKPATPESIPVESAGFSAAVAKEVPVSKSVFDAEKLQRELSREFNTKQYILQLGVFKSEASAERYRKLLSESGFTTHMVKTKGAGNVRYRVQLGPFSDKNQAMSAQRELLKKSVNGIVRIFN